MWKAPDGRVNTIALPLSGVPNGVRLRDLLVGLTASQLRILSERLDSSRWEVADALDSVPFSAVEAEFAHQPPPTEFLATLDWDELVSDLSGEALTRIELRWRLDVLEILDQAVADLPELDIDLHGS